MAFIPLVGELKNVKHLKNLGIVKAAAKLTDKAGAVIDAVGNKVDDVIGAEAKKAGGLFKGLADKADNLFSGLKRKADEVFSGAKGGKPSQGQGFSEKGYTPKPGERSMTKAEWEKAQRKARVKENGSAFGKMSPADKVGYGKYWDEVGNNLAKENISQYRKEILNGNIKKTTGGKVNSNVTTVAVDTHDGSISHGLSGMKNNPTRNQANSVMDDIIQKQGKSQTNYPLENCGEYNAINSALNNGSDIADLKVYSVDVKSGGYKAPCANCQEMYGGVVDFVD